MCAWHTDVDQDGIVDGSGAGGGKVCGQVGSLSPFLVAVGPALTTTTTLAGDLVPGGPTSKASSDCYLEMLVAGIENVPPDVEDGRKIFCTDGETCDRGPCGDNLCSMRARVCINQNDARLPGCTPPAALEKASVTSKLGIAVPQTLAGAACTELVAVTIEARVNGNGKYLATRPRAVPGGGALQVRRNSSPSKRPEVRQRSMYSK